MIVIKKSGIQASKFLHVYKQGSKKAGNKVQKCLPLIILQIKEKHKNPRIKKARKQANNEQVGEENKQV